MRNFGIGATRANYISSCGSTEAAAARRARRVLNRSGGAGSRRTLPTVAALIGARPKEHPVSKQSFGSTESDGHSMSELWVDNPGCRPRLCFLGRLSDCGIRFVRIFGLLKPKTHPWNWCPPFQVTSHIPPHTPARLTNCNKSH